MNKEEGWCCIDCGGTLETAKEEETGFRDSDGVPLVKILFKCLKCGELLTYNEATGFWGRWIPQ